MVSVALRPRLRLVKGGRSVEVIALVNSGYETREPEVLVPASIAAQLSLSGDEPGALVKEYKPLHSPPKLCIGFRRAPEQVLIALATSITGVSLPRRTVS